MGTANHMGDWARAPGTCVSEPSQVGCGSRGGWVSALEAGSRGSGVLLHGAAPLRLGSAPAPGQRCANKSLPATFYLQGKGVRLVTLERPKCAGVSHRSD